eukprot:1188886-Prorocentrum_minimum.AAC.6
MIRRDGPACHVSRAQGESSGRKWGTGHRVRKGKGERRVSTAPLPLLAQEDPKNQAISIFINIQEDPKNQAILPYTHNTDTESTCWSVPSADGSAVFTTDAARLVSSEHNTHLPADHMGGPVLAGSTIGGLEETSLGEPN